MEYDNTVELPPWLRHSTRIAGIGCIAFILWAGFAEVDEAVKGHGRTVSSGQNKMIQHMEGGIVADILVQEGAMVEKDQPLFRIHNVGMSSSLSENMVQLHSLESAIIRLNAEINETALVFDTPASPEISALIENEKQQFASRNLQRAEELRIVQEQIIQKERSLEELYSKVTNIKRELATATEQFDIVDGLQKAGATSANRVLDAEAKVNRFRTELDSAKKQIPITNAELNEAKGRLEETRARQKNTLLEELREATLESQQVAERLKADKDRMSRTDMLAPTKGIVNRLYVHTIGGTIRPGETLAEITPLNDSIIVEAKIAPEHRAKIWVGQEVKVRVTAFEYAEFGTLAGTVTDISADSFSEEQSEKLYYRVKVAMKDVVMDDDKQIMPGMLTEVNILTGSRTVLSYLLRPLTRVKEDAFRE